jgi:N-acetylglucosaminyldiphosphoundecaprenol N-acetyl-beta-D-mannosaminyltransferase
MKDKRIQKQEILGVSFDLVTSPEAISQIQKLIEKGKEGNSFYIVKPNAEILTYAAIKTEFRNILNQASLVIPDGVGLLLSSRFLNKPLKGRIGGSELMEQVVSLCEKNNYSIGIFGATLSSNNKLAEKLKERYKDLNILLQQEGFNFKEDYLLENLKRLKPDVLFVALGFPKQEEWIFKNYKKVGLPLMIAEGGSFDFLSGEVKRAPVALRKIGLEWLFRLIKQPWRLKRQLSLLKFIFLILKEKFFPIENPYQG